MAAQLFRRDQPCIVAPLQPHIAESLALLVRRCDSGLSERDKKLGIDLLVQAYCDVVDHTLLRLLDDIGARYGHHHVSHARRVADDIKARATHYVTWAGGLIATKRLPPVIAHFDRLVQPLEIEGTTTHHVVLPISGGLAMRGNAVLASLRDGSADDLHEGIELLSRVIEELMVPLAIEPKNLLNFNLLVSKPLDGAIVLVRSLIVHALSRFGHQVHRDLYPLVGAHLQRFLIVN